MRRSSVWVLVLAIIGCGSVTMTPSAQSGSMPRDGELTLPGDYKSFPVFLHEIQKPDAVRDLYINPAGAKAQQGEAFANGSILVMEICNAKKNTKGAFEKGADGNLVKADLAKIFVMQKGAGMGKRCPGEFEKRRLDLLGVQTQW